MNHLLHTPDGRIDFPIYPGHAITIAVQIAHLYPNLDAARATGSTFPAALENNEISGGGGNVYAALGALKRLRDGASLETELERADAGREYDYRAEWPAACEQARRYLATIDLVAWVRQ